MYLMLLLFVDGTVAMKFNCGCGVGLLDPLCHRLATHTASPSPRSACPRYKYYNCRIKSRIDMHKTIYTFYNIQLEKL